MAEIASPLEVNPHLPLLTTKLYAPRPRANFVSRPRLITRLNQTLAQQTPSVTLVSAPTGYGKSTLIGEWLHQLRDEGGGLKDEKKNLHPSREAFILHPLNAAWLSLDQADNEPVRFWSYCIAALQAVQPDLGQASLALLHSTQLPSLENVLATLINEVAVISADFVLVLDDYHLIETSTIHQTLSFLLDNLPPSLHLIILSRTDPPLPLAHLRARGQLLELRVADLRFTPDEATAFLNQVMGLNLSTAEVSILKDRTEGWVAGLQLAALSLQGRDTQEVRDLIATFRGSHRFVLDYLVEAVLQHQPEDIQNFLLQTSILDRLCGPLCDAVLGRGAEGHAASGAPKGGGRGDKNLSPAPPLPGSPALGLEVLEYLERANLFIIPLDDERRWYRYHHLFADLLRSLLQRRVEGRHVTTLHRRAADWYEQHGLVAEAMSHALATADVERTTRLVERHARSMLSRSEMTTLLSWLNALPDEVVRTKPQLSLFEAWALVLTGQLDAVEPRLREVEQHRELAGEITAIRATVAYFRRDFPGAIELYRQALAHLPADNLFLRGAVALSLGVAYTWSGDMVNASQVLAEAITTNRATSNHHAALIAMSNLGQVQVEQSHLRQAAERYRQALEFANKQATAVGRPPLPAVGAAYVGLGSLLYERNDLEAAQHHLLEGVRFAEQGTELGVLINGYTTLARVKQAQGDPEGALALAEQAEQLGQGYNSLYWATQAATCRARLWLRQGQLEAAKRWVQERQLGADALPDYLHEVEHLTLARLLMATNDWVVATGLLGRLLEAAEAGGRRGRVIEALALQALVCWAQRDTDQALTMLHRALLLAEPEDYLRLFLDEGTPMEQLLFSLRSQLSGGSNQESGVSQVYLEKLLAAFKAELKGQRTPTKALVPSLVEPLSERELEILRLMAVGMSNQDIAQKVVVTVGTVKWHLNNIYGKLDVCSRTQAIARARELGLL